MDNRNEDKLNRGKISQPSDTDRKASSKDEKDVPFGQNIGRAQPLSEQKRQSGMVSEGGRDSGSSGLDDDKSSGSGQY